MAALISLITFAFFWTSPKFWKYADLRKAEKIVLRGKQEAVLYVAWYKTYDPPIQAFFPWDDLALKEEPSTFPWRSRYKLLIWVDLFNFVLAFFGFRALSTPKGGGGGAAPLVSDMGGGGILAPPTVEGGGATAPAAALVFIFILPYINWEIDAVSEDGLGSGGGRGPEAVDITHIQQDACHITTPQFANCLKSQMQKERFRVSSTCKFTHVPKMEHLVILLSEYDSQYLQ
ncbi:hypothetical protein SLEP1_g9747 [Rubroshorea leprosula]|uniref:Uncharacterized protein n=1 Tax=Rubroshorea leprosula TaxID=152421 RepID=A0AAV5I5V9_9ROSI|nr:hypothetical protein SLEP1_g9747 [Rubroshorea leprosula]